MYMVILSSISTSDLKQYTVGIYMLFSFILPGKREIFERVICSFFFEYSKNSLKRSLFDTVIEEPFSLKAFF